MKERLRRFMMGRRGMDRLNIFLGVLTYAFALLNFLIPDKFFIGKVLSVLVIVGAFCFFGRFFSRNLAKRDREERSYLHLRRALTDKLASVFGRSKEDKDTKIFRCPNCGQRIRVPRRKGKIMIHCPKCGNDFIRKT